jgi:PAS domain S-box-containing protein
MRSMTSQPTQTAQQVILRSVELRARALERLTGGVQDAERASAAASRASAAASRASAAGPRASAAGALAVLHELASSPATAADALALLHELQVNQVELELQEEELRTSRAALEAELVRRIQLYDFAPLGSFTIDRSTALYELNLTGARLLGQPRDALLGRALDDFLAPDSSRALHAMLVRAGTGSGTQAGTLQLLARQGGAARTVHASIAPDPAGERFLVGFLEA